MPTQPNPFPAGSGSAGDAAAIGITHWLSLAAAPTFGIMALLTATMGNADMICSTMQGASPFGGMVPMYLLMSVFHIAPWLRLLSRQRSGARRS
ncbi:hypothetical protein QD357_26070 [Rhizobium sp. BR 317]|uniref:hypothetical protein n=1 Tax=Rhizobium sp. BR 317 TaxID=3040015 RepID=UPI0039BF66C2